MIESLYRQWLSLQPLKEEYQHRLNQKFMLEFNYNSNHIEGNTLTYGQTELLLMFGRVAEETSMKDLEEMKAHNVALKMIQAEAAEREKPLTEHFIRTLHHTLLREDYTVYRNLPDGTTTSYVVHAGCYKTRPNSVITVTGERFEYASPEETPALMNDLVTWYNQAVLEGKLSPIELAAIFHYRYIRIHPFEDGNGRIARLLVNYILFRFGYPMVVVQSKDKEHYLAALHKCDVNVGPVPSDGAHAAPAQLTAFVDYMSHCLEYSLQLCIRAAKGEDLEEEDDFEKRIKILEKQSKKPIRFNNDERGRLQQQMNKLAAFIQKKISSLQRFFHDIECGVFDVNPDDSKSDAVLEQKVIVCTCYHPNENLLSSDARLQYNILIEFYETGYRIPMLDRTYQYGTDLPQKDQELIIKLVREALLKQLEDAMNG